MSVEAHERGNNKKHKKIIYSNKFWNVISLVRGGSRKTQRIGVGMKESRKEGGWEKRRVGEKEGGREGGSNHGSTHERRAIDSYGVSEMRRNTAYLFLLYFYFYFFTVLKLRILLMYE